METIRLEDDSFKLFSGIGFLEDIVPGLAYVWETKKMQRLKKNANTVMKNYLTKHFKQHLETFDKSKKKNNK